MMILLVNCIVVVIRKVYWRREERGVFYIFGMFIRRICRGGGGWEVSVKC